MLGDIDSAFRQRNNGILEDKMYLRGRKVKVLSMHLLRHPNALVAVVLPQTGTLTNYCPVSVVILRSPDIIYTLLERAMCRRLDAAASPLAEAP